MVWCLLATDGPKVLAEGDQGHLPPTVADLIINE